jgi:hypothetical protein
MQEVVSGGFDGFNNLGVGVSGGGDGDAGRQIDETVAVYIPHFRAAPFGHNKRVGAGGDRGNNLPVTFK